MNRAQQIGSPNKMSLGHRRRIFTTQEDRCLLRMMHANNRFLSRPRLRAQLIGRTGRRLSVRIITRRLIAAGYHSRKPTRCHTLILVHLQCRHHWTSRHRAWVIATGNILSPLASQDSSCITQVDELGCAAGRVKATLVSLCREQMVMLVHLSSSGLDFTMVTKVSWLCWMAPWTSKCIDVWCNKVSYPGKEPPTRTILSWSRIMLFPTQPEPPGISWRARTWKLWIEPASCIYLIVVGQKHTWKFWHWSLCRLSCLTAPWVLKNNWADIYMYIYIYMCVPLYILYVATVALTEFSHFLYK